MTLSMMRPWKHPDSGYYWSRKRVPDDLRDIIGKQEERFSLGTRDPGEAKRLHALKGMCYALVDERLVARRLAAEADDRERLARAVRLFSGRGRYALGSPAW